jgi:Domain of unknown function (DUF4337)
MSLDEELSEHAEKAKAPFEKKVAASMAVIAAALAVVSVFGQLYANEELLAQQKASDQWAYYQAKSIRRYESDVARDMLKTMSGEQAAIVAEAYGKNAERYEKEGAEIQDKAKELGAESDLKGRQALRLHIGEIFLEIGIVFATLAILTKRDLVWWTAILSASAGIAIGITTRFID